MKQPTRGHQPIVNARWAAMYAMRLAGYSYADIGRFFNRDHSTVIYAIKQMEAAK
jgi:chromosomal replication initiation ATPase DnaA